MKAVTPYPCFEFSCVASDDNELFERIAVLLQTFGVRIFCVFVSIMLPAKVFADVGTIQLGMSAGFTGPTQSVAMEVYRGSTAYFSRVNARGGIKGHPVAIAVRNDSYDPDPAIENPIIFIEKEHVFCLIDDVGAPTMTHVLPLLKTLDQSHTFLFFPFSGAQPQRESPYMEYLYNLRASSCQEIAAIVDMLVSLGKRRIAVFFQADAYCRISDAVSSIPDPDIGIDAPIRFGKKKNQGVDSVFFTTVRNEQFVPIGDWSAFAH